MTLLQKLLLHRRQGGAMLTKVVLLLLMLMLMLLLLLWVMLGRQQRMGFLFLLDRYKGARLGRGSTPDGPLMMCIS